MQFVLESLPCLNCRTVLQVMVACYVLAHKHPICAGSNPVCIVPGTTAHFQPQSHPNTKLNRNLKIECLFPNLHV